MRCGPTPRIEDEAPIDDPSPASARRLAVRGVMQAPYCLSCLARRTPACLRSPLRSKTAQSPEFLISDDRVSRSFACHHIEKRSIAAGGSAAVQAKRFLHSRTAMVRPILTACLGQGVVG